VRHAEGSEHVEPYDSPAEGAEVIVDLERQPPNALATLGHSGPIGAASFRAAAIQNDLHRGIPGKRPPGILVQLLLVTRDDEYLLGDSPVGVVSVLRTFRPGLGKGMEPRRHTQRPLIEEPRQ
jgi:hypothetical protein